MQWEIFLGYLTGLRFVTSEIDLPTLLRTGLVVNICNAIMCRVIAHNNGMPKNPWTAIGLLLGFWAIAGALLVSSIRSLRHDEGGR